MLNKRPMPELDALLHGSNIMMRVAAIAVICTLAMCHKAHSADMTNLIPDMTIEAEHMSHLTQHRPFTGSPTNYGANLLNIGLVWSLGASWQFTLAEGIALDRHYPNIPSYGELIGPREQFTARVSYTIYLGGH